MTARTLAALLCLTAIAGCGAEKPPRPNPASTPTASPATRAVVLGEYGFLTRAPGWGDAHPHRLVMGGDPALVVHDIRWRRWGSPHARGVGRAAAFTYQGGSTYSKQVRVELRAYELGRCAESGPRAYRNLRLRMPPRPGAPMGRWFILGGGDQGLCKR